MEAQISQSRHIVPPSRLWWAILLGIFLATAANVVFFIVMTEVFEMPMLFPNQPVSELAPLGVSDVILFSVIFSTGASIVFVIVGSLSKRPARTFLIISLVVLAISLALPLKIPSPPATMAAKFSLITMHIIGATIVVGILILLGSSREE